MTRALLLITPAVKCTKSSHASVTAQHTPRVLRTQAYWAYVTCSDTTTSSQPRFERDWPPNPCSAASMPSRARTWAKRSLRVVAITTGLIGGLYMFAQYALARFNDMQERLLRDRVARENLRRRFLQNQEDCNFTIMALLPTLATQIFEEMDVESISHALREQNKKPQPATPPAVSEQTGPKPESVPDQPASDEEKASAATNPQSTDMPQEPSPGENLATDQPSEPVSAEAEPTVPVNEEERRATKLRLWNEIKHTSFERTFTTLYTLVFLSLQIHVQLNLLGRRSYMTALEQQSKRDALGKTQQDGNYVEEPHYIELHGDGTEDTVRGDASADERLSQDTEKKYLTSSYWFLHRGWREVAAYVRRAVREEVDDMPLKTMLTFSHFEALVERIRDRVERCADNTCVVWAAPNGFRGILLPESERDEMQMLQDAGALEPENPAMTPSLRMLLDETKDYIDSPDFASVFAASSHHVFSLFLHHIASSYGVRASEVRRTDKPLLLAKVLPLVSQQAQVALNATPNDYVTAIVEGRELRALSVLMYTAWDEGLGW